jgi:hypothetical protein
MAKGQKRGNREVRKPKAKEPASAPTGTVALAKGLLVPTTVPNKKS